MFPGQVTMAQKPTEISPVFASYHAPVDQLVAQTALVELAPVEYLKVPVSNPSVGGSGYTYGYCTWATALKREQAGLPVPRDLGNAIDWPVNAARYGIPEGHEPRVNAAVVMPAHDPAGHVAFTDKVNADGSIVIIAMNEAGWNVWNTRTIPAALAATYTYIYW